MDLQCNDAPAHTLVVSLADARSLTFHPAAFAFHLISMEACLQAQPGPASQPVATPPPHHMEL